MQGTTDTDSQALESRLLLEAVFARYGYDFRDYAPASLRRRILACMNAEGLRTISGLQERVLHDPACIDRFLLGVTVHVTAMFRDPSFYAALRRKVMPMLHTYPFVRIWVAGCSTGEEVYSLAIVLREEGLYDKCRIYATDLSEGVLRNAMEGVLPLAAMKDYTDNYQKAGGKTSFSDYYTAKYDRALLQPSLRDNVVFAPHNLATDASFNEFNLILCRNVMIYFGKSLQERVHRLLYGSLVKLGVLALGKKESLHLTPHESFYQELDRDERLYRRIA